MDHAPPVNYIGRHLFPTPRARECMAVLPTYNFWGRGTYLNILIELIENPFYFQHITVERKRGIEM